MNGTGYLETLVLNLIGAVVGAVMGLLLRAPRDWRDARRRALFSVLAGISLTPLTLPLLGRYLDLNTGPESMVAAATLTSIGAWFVAKRALRRFDSWWGKQ